MSGLVEYCSSDEEDQAHRTAKSVDKQAAQLNAPSAASKAVPYSASDSADGLVLEARASGSSIAQASSAGPPVGPTLGPAFGSDEADIGPAPESPYSSNRTLIHNLTLPTVPNFAIPPSPPGSPPPGVDKKVAHFLELKKQGVHFNEKLANSSALKNPSLLGKLMAAAGLDEAQQHDTSLPKDLWDPTMFPEWAYKESLAKAQQEAQRIREEEMAKGHRESIEFVSASASGHSSRAATPGAAWGKGIKGSAVERVMAGLDRERTKPSPPTSRLASRSGRDDQRERRLLRPKSPIKK